MNALEKYEAFLLGAFNAVEEPELRAVYTARARAAREGLIRDLGPLDEQLKWLEARVKDDAK